MNAVWNSYGQLCGCPEIFKKSCKFFCRELDIRVPKIMHTNFFHTACFAASFHFMVQIILCHWENTIIRLQAVI